MSNPTHVFVTVPEGRACPFPPHEASAPGAALLIAVPGKVYRVPYSSFARRRIIAGDLGLSNIRGDAVDTVTAAAAPEGIQLDETGAVASDQRPDDVITAELKRVPARGPAPDIHPWSKE